MRFVIYCETIPRNRICWMFVTNECELMSMNVNSVNNNLLQNNGIFISQALKNLGWFTKSLEQQLTRNTGL